MMTTNILQTPSSTPTLTQVEETMEKPPIDISASLATLK